MHHINLDSNYDKPHISILMSVYNGWPYIQQSIESILTQSYRNYELLIINDGSRDKTPEFLNSLNDPRIKVFHQDNQGLGKPLNKWLKLCKGKYIMRVDADDYCDPKKIEKQVDYLETNPNVIMLGTQIRFFEDNLSLESRSLLPLEHKAIYQGMKRGWHTMCHPTIMFRRELLDLTAGYTVTGAGEDWSFILDAARHGKLSNLNDALYYMRIHDSSNSWKGADDVTKGFVYARKRAKAYEKGINFEYDEFIKAWDARNIFSKFFTKMKAISQIYYRRSTIYRIRGKRYQSTLYLGISSLLDPWKTIGAVVKRLQA